MLGRQESAPVVAQHRVSEDVASSRRTSMNGKTNAPPHPKGPAPAPPAFAAKTTRNGGPKAVEKRQRSLTTVDRSSRPGSGQACQYDRESGCSTEHSAASIQGEEETQSNNSPEAAVGEDTVPPILNVRRRTIDSLPRSSRPRSSPNSFLLSVNAPPVMSRSDGGCRENIYFSINEPLGGECEGQEATTMDRVAASTRGAASTSDPVVAQTTNLSVGDLVARCSGSQSLTLPTPLRITETSILGGRVVPADTKATLCAVHQRAAAQLVDHGQCFIYESVDGTAPVNCLYEVVRGSLAVGSRVSYLWSTKSYASLRDLLAENPSRRRIKLNSSFEIDEDTKLKKHEELLVACDDIVADALTHVPCWRLEVSDGFRSTTSHITDNLFSSKDTNKMPWRIVELVMLPLDLACKLNVCVNSDLLRLRDIIRRFSRQLPVQVLACEHVPARPQPFAMSGDPSVQLRLSTLSRLSLQSVIKESVLMLVVDGVATLVSESQSFVCDLADDEPPDIATICSALGTLATQSLLIRHNYVQSAMPMVRFSAVEPSLAVNGEDTTMQEGIYMDMAGGVYGQIRTDSISSSGSKPYRSVTLDPSVAVQSLTESMEERAMALEERNAVPPPLPGQKRPTLRPPRAPALPSPLPTVMKDGYASTQELLQSAAQSLDVEETAAAPKGGAHQLSLDRHPNLAMATNSKMPFSYPSSSVVVKTRSATATAIPRLSEGGDKTEQSPKGPHYYKPFTGKEVAGALSKASDDSTVDSHVYGVGQMPQVIRRLKSPEGRHNTDYRRSIDDMDLLIDQNKERRSDLSTLSLAKDSKGFKSLFRRKPKPIKLDRSSTTVRHRMTAGSITEESTAKSFTLSDKNQVRIPLNSAMSPTSSGQDTDKGQDDVFTESKRSPAPAVKPYRTSTVNDLDAQGKGKRTAPRRPVNPPANKAPPRPSYLPPDASPSTTPSSSHGSELGARPRLEHTLSLTSQSSVSSDGDLVTPTSASRQLYPSASSIASSSGKIPSPAAVPRARPRPVSPSRASLLKTASRTKSDSAGTGAAVSATVSHRHMSVREPAFGSIQELETISASLPCDSGYLNDEYSVPRISPATGLPIPAVLPRSRSPSPPPSPTGAAAGSNGEDESDAVDGSGGNDPVVQCDTANNPTSPTPLSAANKRNLAFSAPPAPPGKPPRAKPGHATPPTTRSTASSKSPSTPSRKNSGQDSQGPPVPSPRKASGDPRSLSIACAVGDEAVGAHQTPAVQDPAPVLRYQPPGADGIAASTEEQIYTYSKLADDSYGMLDHTPPAKAPKPKAKRKPTAAKP